MNRAAPELAAGDLTPRDRNGRGKAREKRQADLFFTMAHYFLVLWKNTQRKESYMK
jgi:hypothetical protein